MKKLMFLSLCFLYLGNSLYAQDSNDLEIKKFHFGLIAMPKLTWAGAESKNLEGNGVKAGLTLGLSSDLFFAKNYALSIDILHSIGGYKLKADSISRQSNRFADVGINYKENAFQIPISLKLRTNEIGYWTYYAQFGIAPTFAYRSIKATYDKEVFEIADDGVDRLVNEGDNDFDYNNVPFITETNRRYYLEEDNVSKFRYPLLIGLGAEWNISGNTSLIIGMRYHYALSNVMKGEGAVARVSSFNLLTGVRF